MEHQQLGNQKGEIEFRRKLVRHQIEDGKVFDDYFDGSATKEILRDRMAETKSGMTRLAEAGVPLSPYLEIGAERGQRSLVMENDMNARGAAADISADMLRSCDYYKAIFNCANLPLRVCCDANNLPFQSNSIPFVFCYETLHHFPSPTPIVAEIYRVLRPEGYFWFDDEPYKRVLHWNLYDGGKGHNTEAVKRGTFRKAMDRLFARMACNEVEHGIIENLDIPTGEWKQALSLFTKRDVWLQPTQRINFKAKLFDSSSSLKYLIAYLLGGRITALCQKGPGLERPVASITEALICPSCRLSGKEISLRQENDASFVCSECHRHYPVVNGVAFVFEYGKLRELYPEVFQSLEADGVNVQS